ncbi:urea ABC transporter ATP-binding protein UrtD [Paenibacillus aurantius]|uniref:Urea ABC transporter ATP-binding protein UrtD n=1 Tax=Paenibacillus aurantius TaxID=2918900 RepID=A0AA96LA62_9BACL|nr:urea ABC transporter ATP-binding protein UrtD [Paenibacillus aurantius]WNQ09525.1 urea ABC transporter ATP-binding protein UrtD [Paenibacillus aurantius]
MNEPSPSLAAEGELIRVEDVEVAFDGFKALRGLSFTLMPAELRFLIGPNGAGKTTLLDVLCGKVKPTRGTVRYQGHIDLTRQQEHQIVQLGIGRKFQAPSIFSTLTVEENLLLSMRQRRGLLSSLTARTTSAQRSKMREHLELIGLAGKALHKAGSLSHGEKQWLEIGMLLIQEPELLLLDEPAAGMTDSETEKTGELLHKINDRQTVLVVVHDMEFVRRFAKTVTVMHEGSVLCEGTMDEIQADDKVAEVYLGRRGERDA